MCDRNHIIVIIIQKICDHNHIIIITIQKISYPKSRYSQLHYGVIIRLFCIVFCFSVYKISVIEGLISQILLLFIFLSLNHKLHRKIIINQFIPQIFNKFTGFILDIVQSSVNIHCPLSRKNRVRLLK